LTARFSCDIFVTLWRERSRAASQAARVETRRKKQKENRETEESSG
jgi:hypothetical protein